MWPYERNAWAKYPGEPAACSACAPQVRVAAHKSSTLHVNAGRLCTKLHLRQEHIMKTESLRKTPTLDYNIPTLIMIFAALLQCCTVKNGLLL